jgi:biopolymer transport protein ExbD
MRRFRSRRRKPELNAQINVTNLVDVSLTILVMFMMIAPLIEHSMRVALPKAQEKKISEPDQVKVEIARNKALYVNNVRVTLRELAAKLSVNPNISVNVQGDAAISYQDLVDVLDAIREAGVTRVGLATEVKVER